MSGWLNETIDGYLASVTEREFDSVFIALLRSLGFDDVHQIHGSYEFGKDFIAKRDRCQWAFQTKAGDIALPAWRQVRPQVEEMLWNDIAHPSFDASSDRRAVLVTTGRLVGAAAADAQQYATTLERRSRQQWWKSGRKRSPSAFVVWDRETVGEHLRSSPDLSLNNWDREPLRNLLGLLADIDRRIVTNKVIERSTRGWENGAPWQAVLAASLAGNRLMGNRRADLACAVALALSRAGALMTWDQRSEDGESVMNASRALFREYATELLKLVDPTLEDAERLYRAGMELPGSTTYPVRCSVVLQILGMLGLLHYEEGEPEEGARIADCLERFVAHQPGAAHPISDRWAVSLIPASLLLRRAGSPSLEAWLENIVIWICDRHERQPGLASVYASADQEITQLLGYPYEHLNVRRRKQSFLGTVVLDLAATLGLDSLYDDALNDFAAVDLAFPVVEARDELGQYCYEGPGIYAEANIQFDHEYDREHWKRSVHHHRSPTGYFLDGRGRSWEQLACSLVLRDRHFLPTTLRLAGLG